MLDRPAFGDQPVEHPPHERVVSGEQVLGAGGEGVGDIVLIEEEHDGREREHGEHAGVLNPLGEHRENDEEVDREEANASAIASKVARRGSRRDAHAFSIG